MNESSKKTILITGANGLLGQKLVLQILEEDQFIVIPTGLGDCRITDLRAKDRWKSLDITNRDEVLDLFESFKPDFVINTAAMTNVDICEAEKNTCVKLNIYGVNNLIHACETLKSHLVHLSTDFIFDGEAGPYSEEDAPNPVNYYGWTKMKAEENIKNAKIKWSIIRTVLVYGIANDMSRSNIILWVKNSLEKGETLQLVNDQFRTPTLAEDLAEGCLLVIKKQAEGVFNISGKDLLTPYDMAIATADYFNLDKSKIKKTNSKAFTQKAKRPMKTGFIIDKAINNLGYSPKSFMDGIGILSKQLKLANS
ncbi:dTDP-4-dehydrorhamnose reductase [Belliella baltica DSM 15883]|uniref:dTDP-4-dehydrorhamnose reductase n=1 Tax=Belliella baltica (strain DSM 15883 / CIP 108006 / LMG 21964 / BA134) TaxID=866536 RepID=I3Z162_BELBD|nr:SDR family oxidoreductase [Belliella baltica]AFL82980.1 dTDP-4-dehydrorhamnose reductase [Belliella baltica DSM 15883]